MQNKKLVIQIDKPLEEVFEFSLDPQNTPKWIDSIVIEERNENPTKLGTKYRNRGEKTEWSEYTITEFKKNESFVFAKNDGSYFVKYTFKPISNNTTELEYYEWVNHGDIQNPFTQNVLDKLKKVIESSL